jgi:hypothetical protein
MSKDKKLKKGQEITLNIPFTYTIGEKGFHSDKTLNTIEDCKEEILEELNNGFLNNLDILITVEK